MIPEKMDYLVQRHIQYLKKQVDVLLEKNIPVLILTAIPVYGGLPWSHFDENGRLVWEAGLSVRLQPRIETAGGRATHAGGGVCGGREKRFPHGCVECVTATMGHGLDVFWM